MPDRRPRGRRLDRADALPLWAQLRDDLMARLSLGEFAERFPGEIELAQTYDVSRHTVREALRRLRQDGVVQSSRGRVSTARQQMISQPLGSLYSLFQELETLGIEQRSEILAADRREDPVVAVALGLPDAAPLIFVERLRLADGEPLAWDRTWLPEDIGGRLLETDLTHTGLYEELERLGGVRLTGGQEHITAVVPTPAQRNLLGLRRGIAALSIERTGCLHRRPVEWRKTLVRGDRFGFATEWSPRSGFQVGIRGGRPD